MNFNSRLNIELSLVFHIFLCIVVHVPSDSVLLLPVGGAKLHSAGRLWLPPSVSLLRSLRIRVQYLNKLD